MSKRQGSTSKGKSTAPPERSSSPLANLASISQTNAEDLTNDHIVKQFSNADSNFRALQLSNHKTRDLIGGLDFKQTKLEGKIDSIIDAVNKITDHIKTNREKPPHFKQEPSTVISAPTYSLHQKQFMKDPMALHRSIHSDVEYLKFTGENYSAWEQQVNTTLDFVFRRENFLSKPTNWILVDDEQEPAV
ncbi:hypothetical protein PTTG_31008, partial [Puccinia triticina 1-1 BBBD Race 1]